MFFAATFLPWFKASDKKSQQKKKNPQPPSDINSWSIILWCYCPSKPVYCTAISSIFFHLKDQKDAAECLQRYNLSSCSAIISSFLPSVAQKKAGLLWKKDCECIGGQQKRRGSAQHASGNCATCVGRAEILNPLRSSNPGLGDLLNVWSETQWPREKDRENRGEDTIDP